VQRAPCAAEPTSLPYLHALSFLAGIHGTMIASLGVSSFGQSGDIEDLYRHFGIDSETITGAALDLIDT
jgi:pyruvate dehydrogenase E1 component